MMNRPKWRDVFILVEYADGQREWIGKFEHHNSAMEFRDRHAPGGVVIRPVNPPQHPILRGEWLAGRRTPQR